MDKEKDPISQLQEKLATSMLPYEALQYVQSFVARKKKHISPNVTSTLVFLGAKKLIEENSSADAGTLLLWFLEGGAGDKNEFHIESKEIEGSSDLYCDIDRLCTLIKKVEPLHSSALCEKIYIPLVKLIMKVKPPRQSSLLDRVTFLEDMFADVFETTKHWSLACKSVERLEDMERLAKNLNSWAEEGYFTEKPLYFARSALQLFADGNSQLGIKLVKESSMLIDESIYCTVDGNPYSSLAIWHLTLMIADLTTITARPGPDKAKIFKQLSSRYSSHLNKTDPKLVQLVNIIGERSFGVVGDAPPGGGLDILSMLGGGGKGGAPDMNKLMQMMSQMR